jgi:hypothetical protein
MLQTMPVKMEQLPNQLLARVVARGLPQTHLLEQLEEQRVLLLLRMLLLLLRMRLLLLVAGCGCGACHPDDIHKLN